MAHHTLGGVARTPPASRWRGLKADECQIYTHVDGVYTTDPRCRAAGAGVWTHTFEEMLEMASLGSKVLQIRSVEFPASTSSLRVLSSSREGPARSISYEENEMSAIISGIAFK